MNISTNFEKESMKSMELSIPSCVTYVSKLEPLIRNLFDQVCCKEDHYGSVLIAVTEAVNNAIVHGNSEDVNKKVFININYEDGKIYFSIQDEGNGFDYENVPDPTAPDNIAKIRGRGVFLMKKLSDEIEFEKDGQLVKMCFNVS